jgi:hypothetical protein
MNLCFILLGMEESLRKYELKNYDSKVKDNVDLSATQQPRLSESQYIHFNGMSDDRNYP